jgi:hypothetical protein
VVWEVRAGVSLFSLSRRMGTSVEMLARGYGHLLPDAAEYERGLLDAFDSSHDSQRGRQMDEFVLRIFQSEVERQSRVIRLAALDLERALTDKDGKRCWMALQTLLSAAANVSKLLWGTSKDTAC